MRTRLAAALLLSGAARRAAASPFVGFDVVLVAGQSNSVGSAKAPQPEFDSLGSTDGAPIFYLRAGSSAGPGWDASLYHMTGLADESVYKVPATGPGTPGGSQEIGVPFAKRYVAGGHLAAGRAVLLVNAGWGGTGFSCGAWKAHYDWPSAQTALELGWAASEDCNPSVSDASFVTTLTVAEPVTMSLFTHSVYRTDMAMSMDAATMRPVNASDITVFHPANVLVAVLWHQGEHDSSAGMGVPSYASCLGGVLSAWRRRYSLTAPVIAGTFTDWYAVPGTPLVNEYLSFFRAAFGGESAYPNATSPVRFRSTFAPLELADASMVRDAAGVASIRDPVPYDTTDPIHFSNRGYQILGDRYFEAYLRALASVDPSKPSTASRGDAALPPPPAVAEHPPCAAERRAPKWVAPLVATFAAFGAATAALAAAHKPTRRRVARAAARLRGRAPPGPSHGKLCDESDTRDDDSPEDGSGGDSRAGAEAAQPLMGSGGGGGGGQRSWGASSDACAEPDSPAPRLLSRDVDVAGRVVPPAPRMQPPPPTGLRRQNSAQVLPPPEGGRSDGHAKGCES